MTTIDAEAREDLVDLLDSFPTRLQELVESATEEQLRAAGPGGGWGGVEILCHLRDLEELFLERMDLMLDEDNPQLEAVEDSLWPIARDYINQDPLDALEEFVELRRQVVDNLENAEIADWGRTGRHPRMGQITIRDYAERAVERDGEHEAMLHKALRHELPVTETPPESDADESPEPN
jgi:hypothetical protein